MRPVLKSGGHNLNPSHSVHVYSLGMCASSIFQALDLLLAVC